VNDEISYLYQNPKKGRARGQLFMLALGGTLTVAFSALAIARAEAGFFGLAGFFLLLALAAGLYAPWIQRYYLVQLALGELRLQSVISGLPKSYRLKVASIGALRVADLRKKPALEFYDARSNWIGQLNYMGIPPAELKRFLDALRAANPHIGIPAKIPRLEDVI